MKLPLSIILAFLMTWRVDAMTVENYSADYFAVLNPAQNKHNTCDASTASGSAVATLTKNKFCIYLSYSGIAKELYSHIHGPAPVGASANVLFGLSSKSTKRDCVTLTNAQVNMLNAGLLYVNVHTSNFKGGCTDGEIRGQFFPVKHT